MNTYRISELARRTGVPASTLRFYEQAGLLPAERTGSGYRMYGEDAVARLELIASAKQLGLPLEEIRELLGARSGCAPTCGHDCGPWWRHASLTRNDASRS